MSASLRTRSASFVAATLFLVASGIASASTDRQNCIAGKREAAGRVFQALALCDSKAASSGVSPDPVCESQARAKFMDKWAKIDAQYPGTACTGTGDLATVQALVDAAQDEFESLQVVPGPASSCTSRKLSVAGKAGSCSLRCARRTALAGLSVIDPGLASCRRACDDKLGTRFTKAETAGDCHTTGDSDAITTAVEDFVTSVLHVVPEAVPLCELPGTIRHTAMGVTEVPGGEPSWPDLSFIDLPDGFCLHYFATVPNARQVRFAPGGELFVASPSRGTVGGGAGGRASILALPDDDNDGVADSSIGFLSSLPATQGLLFHDGYIYYQDDSDILRRPYVAGDRSASGLVETVATVTDYYSALHWPKPIDVADDGTIYIGNGGDDGETCSPPGSFTGGIMKLDAPSGTPVARGLRNPISVRCSRGRNLCFAIELARDYSNPYGGREKLVPIHDGDDWGFPCCATRNVPYSYISPVPDCSSVAMEGVSFEIGHTPFSLDFAPATWPAPYSGSAIVSLHGVYSTWTGAGVVAIEMDEMTGLPLAGSDLGGSPTGSMSDFATGWDDGTRTHGRPADLTFSSDGRLFLANDNSGVIVWIAPIE